MSTVTLVNGVSYGVVHQFNENRWIVSMDGLFVLIDREPSTGTWDFSGLPASGDEMVILKSLVDSSSDSVTVTN